MYIHMYMYTGYYVYMCIYSVYMYITYVITFSCSLRVPLVIKNSKQDAGMYVHDYILVSFVSLHVCIHSGLCIKFFLALPNSLKDC